MSSITDNDDDENHDAEAMLACFQLMAWGRLVCFFSAEWPACAGLVFQIKAGKSAWQQPGIKMIAEACQLMLMDQRMNSVAYFRSLIS